MNKRIIALLIVEILLFACNKKTTLKNNLQTCFWDILDKRYTQFPNTGFKFKDNGRVYYFQYVFHPFLVKTDSVQLYNDEDEPRPDSWNLEADTILNVRGYKFKILKYNQDSVFLNFYNHKDLIILIKNCLTVSKSKQW